MKDTAVTVLAESGHTVEVPVTDGDDDADAGGDGEQSGRDSTKFDGKVGDKKYEALAKRMAIFTVVKHLCGQGVTPEDIESCVTWRSNLFCKADGALDSAAFVKVATVDSGGIRRSCVRSLNAVASRTSASS